MTCQAINKSSKENNNKITGFLNVNVAGLDNEVTENNKLNAHRDGKE